jgi:bifunctional DNA-binding transcriptional regulator/antitoxin component of YhaV-PrlF toxin-antitoxin module
VRQVRGARPEGAAAGDGQPAPAEGEPAAEVEEAFEELVVVDSAGRLQVPKDYLQRLGIKGRVRLEIRDGEIVIQPAQSTVEAHEAEKLASQMATAPRRHGLRGIFGRQGQGRH